MPLFNYEKYAYPCDDIGEYIELEGPIVEVGKPFQFEGLAVQVVVQTKHGNKTGYAHGPMAQGASRFTRATIRVYDAGGGWYPDNRIVQMSH